MGKLQKIGKWFWLNKERMLLAVLFVVLVYRVYRVVWPTPPEDKIIPSGPRSSLPEDWEDGPPRPSDVLVDLPARAPAELAQNPFWVHGRDRTGTTGTRDEAEGPLGVELTGIKTWNDGTPRAELLTQGTRPNYYAEGEEFQSFRLESINESNNTVRIWSDKHRRSFTLEVKQ